jgi:hypothetical protein
MPTEYGGQGMPTLLSAAVREIFTGANKAFCMCPGLTDAAVHALMLGADDALKAYYLPRLVSGEWTTTMNLTEPQAGSDVGALRTRAVQAADGTYRVFGQKIFISFGDHDLTDNIVHLVLARVAGAPEGSKGISLFVVPKFLPQQGWQGARNDVQCAGIEHKVGNHGSPTCTMVYGDAGEGAVAWLVGEENKGLQTMFVMMNQARSSRHGRGGAERAGLSPGSGVRPRARAGTRCRRQCTAGADHPPPRRAAHAVVDAQPDRGDARAGLHARGGAGPGRWPSGPDGAPGAPGLRRPDDPDLQGLGDGDGRGGDPHVRADPRRHGVCHRERRVAAAA